MSPERHQQITELLTQALERGPEERAAFIEAACAGDLDLRREVESLLAAFGEAQSFIEAPAFAGVPGVIAGRPAPDRGEEVEGQRIGVYQLVREIGHGGMGTVYLADRADEQYREQVALKIVKRGMDSDFILKRFRHERQILATLHHPNIARLLDGGATEEGRPYFVMEYIEGEPVDAYCDHHRLSTPERLKLFRTVCSAVHYAHQNLIVHRDIKPGNILITADGTPKLLDFGIAKILNPEIAQTIEPTATVMRLMTPEYASPEQVRGLPVTTASDIYSLGVVLYELLTGHHPYRLASYLPSEIERVICQQEPTRPSTAVARTEEVTASGGEKRMLTPEAVARTREGQPEKLRRRLAGDLDNIVLMAMRKEPERRYASVLHLSEDLRRHLEGLPVTARKDTLSYRVGKFVSRHTAGVAAAAFVVLSLLAGIVATTWQARVAHAARAKAEKRSGDLRKLANAYLFEFHDAIEKFPGSTPARERLVRLALESLDDLAREAKDDTALQQDLATAYLKVGDVQGRPGFPNLGDTAGALQSYRKSLAIREALPPDQTASPEARRELATNYDRIGDALTMSGDAAAALANYRRGFDVRAALSQADPAGLPNRRDLATSLQRIADALAQTGKAAEALASQRQAVALFESASAAEPENPEAKRNLFISYIKLGDRLARAGDRAGALAHYRQALPISQALADADPQNARAQRELSVCHEKIGNALAALKDRAQGLAHYRESLAIRQRLAEADRKNAEAQRDLSKAYVKIADMLSQADDIAGALANYRQALGIDERLSLANPANMQVPQDCAIDHEEIGNLLAKRGALAEALEQHRQAMRLREEVSQKDPEDTEVLRDLATSYAKLGEVSAGLADRGPAAERRERWGEARAWYQRSLDALLGLQKRGALGKSDAGEPERIAGEIAKCEAALKK